MNKERFETMCKLNAEGYDFGWANFTISEILEIIGETPLSLRDRKLAVARFTELMTYEELADKFGIPLQTIRDNVPKISKALKETCKKLFTR